MDVLGSEISRRAVVRTAAWGVPAVSVAVASPAFAVSGDPIDLSLRVVPGEGPYDFDLMPSFDVWIDYEGEARTSGATLTFTVAAPASPLARSTGAAPQWGPMGSLYVYALDPGVEVDPTDEGLGTEVGTELEGWAFTSSPFNGTSQTHTLVLPDLGPTGNGLTRLLIQFRFTSGLEKQTSGAVVDYVVTAELLVPGGFRDTSSADNVDAHVVPVQLLGGGGPG